ncbi:divergent polysaccharide deacetylase family protein [Propylenella binzhouense]|uniref:Divergent polysaccharide deacetylase family protein n=1 Tax=Propylenella binzhouense TaxID=2555902 RepID=A0A964T765_9HYPH|nr:divergent polysaccharide deacetylase family protein [Propylenella binzhouense]MYZ48657.1 divergent polysaccharide deacetylase family protein [Propylenella binzhouense]
MSANDLNQPLRNRRPRSTGRGPTGIVIPAVVTLGCVLAALALIWVAVVDDPAGGRFQAVVAIADASPDNTASIGKAPAEADRPGRAAAPAAGTETGPDLAAFAGSSASPAFRRAGSQPLPELLESSSFGPLPRISGDGLRPLDAYARSPAGSVAGAGPNSPRIALVLGGLGISQTGTQQAIQTLPPDVTLAFAPYGSSLDRWVTRAREDGHEVVVQVPLEPLGYPQVDPGEHTLLASAEPDANIRDLHWSMGRITSYTAVMNYMGARFASEEPAMRDLLAEIGGRGLAYIDDGTSPGSVARRVGEETGVPVVVADKVVDAVRSKDAIAKELSALEALARRRGGVAVGVASAFPTTIQALAAWIPEAEARGISLVPVSAALAR